MIPGSGRSAGEAIGYPLQYSWASLVAQLIKNPPAMWETWVQSPGWEDSPGEGNDYSLQYSGLENSMDCRVYGVTKSQTQLSDFHFYFHITDTNLCFHQQHVSVLFSPHAPQHLLFLVFLIITILTGVMWYVTVVLIFISLMISDVDHLLVYLLTICMSFL